MVICGYCLDEAFINEETERKRGSNWLTQLKEYDADSFAAGILTAYFVQKWDDDIKINLAIFDTMFLANYFCFKIFAEKTSRNFDNYLAQDIAKFDHPHPGIRMYYTNMVFTYWLLNYRGDIEAIIPIVNSGCHVIIAYEKMVLNKDILKECYYTIGFTEKGVQHVMNLNNQWQELIDEYNEYAYIPIQKWENVDSMLFSVDKNGDFFLK